MYWHHIIADRVFFNGLFAFRLCSVEIVKSYSLMFTAVELKQVKHVIKDVYNAGTAVYHHVLWFSCLSHLCALLATHFKLMETLRIWSMIYNTFWGS